MRITHRTTGIVISIALCVLIASAIGVLSGTLEPTNIPTNTSSLTLEDIYRRLDSGTSGSAIVFTEPTTGPGMTMHTLNEIMAKAPMVDNTTGAAIGHVLAGKFFWGLTSPGAWGLTSGSGFTATSTQAFVPRTTPGAINGVAWPNPRFTLTTSGAVTVTDNLTGLMWARNSASSALSSTAAITYCTGLNLGGYDDWRLPNIRELFSLTDLAYSAPALSNDAGTGQWVTNTSGCSFTNLTSSTSINYLSSTAAALDTSKNWRVYLYDGHVHNDSSPSYVWPVRGGQ
jgi:hypothetical protein